MTDEQLDKGQILQARICAINYDLLRFKGYRLPFFDGLCDKLMEDFKASAMKEMNTELDRLEKEFREL